MRYSCQIRKPNGEMFFGAIENADTREQAEQMLRNWYPGITLTYNESCRLFSGECPVTSAQNPPSYLGQGGVPPQQHVEEPLPMPSSEANGARTMADIMGNGGEEVLPLPPTLNFDPPGKRREKKSTAAPASASAPSGAEEPLLMPALSF